MSANARHCPFPLYCANLQDFASSSSGTDSTCGRQTIGVCCVLCVVVCVYVRVCVCVCVRVRACVPVPHVCAHAYWKVYQVRVYVCTVRLHRKL